MIPSSFLLSPHLSESVIESSSRNASCPPPAKAVPVWGRRGELLLTVTLLLVVGEQHPSAASGEHRSELFPAPYRKPLHSRPRPLTEEMDLMFQLPPFHWGTANETVRAAPQHLGELSDRNWKRLPFR